MSLTATLAPKLYLPRGLAGGRGCCPTVFFSSRVALPDPAPAASRKGQEIGIPVYVIEGELY